LITLRGVLTASAGLITILLSMSTASMPVFTVGFCLLVLVLVLHPPRIKAAAVRHISRECVAQGDLLDVKVTVAVKAPFGGVLYIYDHMPEYFGLNRGLNYAHTDFVLKSSVEIEYTVRCLVRGFHRFGPLRIRCWDPLGLHVRDVELPVDSYVTVYPEMERISHAPFSRSTAVYTERQKTERLGEGREFHSIREYLPGDATSRINWKASVRLRKKMVNQYIEEGITDLVIFVDARAVSGAGNMVMSPLEYSIRGALACAEYALRLRGKVGVVVYGDGVKTVPPSTGSGHLSRILELLTAAEASGGVGFSEALEVTRAWGGVSTAVVFSPLLEDPTFFHALESASFREKVIVVPSVPDIEREVSGQYTVRYTLAQMEMGLHISRAATLGRTYIWYPYRKFEEVVLGGMHA